MAFSGLATSRSSRAWIALICIGLMLVAINIIAGRLFTARLDLTGERLYTLSRGTRQTLARIDEPITVRFYYPTRLGHNLAVPKRTTVGLISSLPLEGDMMAAMRGRAVRPLAIIDQLRQTARIETIGADLDAVPSDMDVLMLVHPQNLPDKTLFASDQFVLKGGQ